MSELQTSGNSPQKSALAEGPEVGLSTSVTHEYSYFPVMLNDLVKSKISLRDFPHIV